MSRRGRWVVAGAIAGALMGAACEGPATDDERAGHEPAVVEPIDGRDVARITLTPRAADRLDIQTGAARRRGDRRVVPTTAVFYDPQGGEWVFTAPEPLVFVRRAVTVVAFTGDAAVLSDGPAAGTRVVTVGVAELLGTEFGVGH